MHAPANALRSPTMEPDWSYCQLPDGVFVPRAAVAHRNEEYDEASFEVLFAMQQRHFWYRGRHRFLLHAARRFLRGADTPVRNGIDLGGGCGGWVRYLRDRDAGLIPNLALGDSSRLALDYAEKAIDPDVARYQVDLLRLNWTRRWDAVFLLDVLEHIPQDAAALTQIREALTPGGYLFVTTPALNVFWSYHDEIAEHQRRYARADFRRLADQTGLELCSTRYFMFFLSPLLYLSRLKRKNLKDMTQEEVRAFVARSHRVPSGPVNSLLASLFALETPLGHFLPFPWGTSILAVFRKR